eukprot:gene19848-21790_t
MAKLLLACFLIAAINSLSFAADEELNEGDINVKVLGQSGKVALKNKKGNNVMITFDAIKELDAANKDVGKTGSKKHNLQTFASQEFTFKTQGLNDTYQGLRVRQIQFTSKIAGSDGNLTVNIYIFKDGGNITTASDEEITVQKGTVKFDIWIRNWKFCGSAGAGCKQSETGNKIDLAIEIKGKKGQKPKERSKKRGKGRRMKTFDLGGADCTLSGQVKKDGVWEAMESGFPKMETKGSKTTFTFRFPKFSSSAFYDPTLDLSSTPPSGALSFNKAINSSSFAADKELNEGDINVKVLGQSGKISIKNKKGGNNAMITFDAIKELDASNSAVGTSGNKKHSLQTFASQEFTFKTQGLNDTYQGLRVRQIQFTSKIAGPDGNLTVNIYIFKDGGNITTANDEEITVQNGTVKFDIWFASWTFCGGADGVSCKKGQTNEVGDKIDLAIEIKGKGSGAPKEKSKKRGKGSKMKTFDIGGADCTLSGQVKKDGVWEAMESGFPKMETKGSKTTFTFRFPRFNSSAFYDPTLDMSSASTTSQPPVLTTPSGAQSFDKGPVGLVCFLVLLVSMKLFL